MGWWWWWWQDEIPDKSCSTPTLNSSVFSTSYTTFNPIHPGKYAWHPKHYLCDSWEHRSLTRALTFNQKRGNIKKKSQNCIFFSTPKINNWMNINFELKFSCFTSDYCKVSSRELNESSLLNFVTWMRLTMRWLKFIFHEKIFLDMTWPHYKLHPS